MKPAVGRCVTIAIVAVLVAACAEERMRDAQQSLQAALAECKDRHKSGDLKTQRETALCVRSTKSWDRLSRMETWWPRKPHIAYSLRTESTERNFPATKPMSYSPSSIPGW